MEKAPRAMRAMRGKTLETVPFQPYFGCTKSFLGSIVKLVLPSNESYESKTGCNRTPCNRTLGSTINELRKCQAEKTAQNRVASLAVKGFSAPGLTSVEHAHALGRGVGESVAFGWLWD